MFVSSEHVERNAGNVWTPVNDYPPLRPVEQLLFCLIRSRDNSFSLSENVKRHCTLVLDTLHESNVTSILGRKKITAFRDRASEIFVDSSYGLGN